MLILTARNPLERLYGSNGYIQIRSSLATLAQGNHGLTVAIDDQADMLSLGLQAQMNDPAGIVAAIRGIASVDPGAAENILLIGGESVLPFWSLSNPVTDRIVDPDNQVLSDNPYGAISDSTDELLAPSRPVGRLPFPESATADEVVALISNLSAQGQGAKPGSALFVNQDWLVYSQRAALTMPPPLDWHIAPGFQLDAETRQEATGGTLYFNLHGFSGDPDWKGYSTVQHSFLPAVTPDGLDRQFVSGAVSFAECCYGAQISGRSAENSCALKLLQEGALFVGATGLAFGSYIAADLLLEDADFLARAFFAGMQAGLTVGNALRTARAMYLQDNSEEHSGLPWECKQKTLLQFVLYGNPEVTLKD